MVTRNSIISKRGDNIRMASNLLTVLSLLGFVLLCKAKSRTEIMDTDFTVLYTADNNTYLNNNLQVLERNDIVFKVKACSDAHILLVDEISNTSHHAIEVVIGGWENSWSVIRDGVQGNVIGETVTYPILHCGEYRTFWIHWTDTHFLVGKGPVVGEQPFLSAERNGERHHSIHYTAFSTGYGHTGVWEIKENTGYHLAIHTPDVTPQAFEYVTKQVKRKDGFFTFRARACHDLHIAMGTAPGFWNYRLNLCAYSNTVHCIFVNGVQDCGDEGPAEICDCNKMKTFWVSWVSGRIKAGEGVNYKQRELINYQQTGDVEVDFLSFSTGWGASGEWIFDTSTENSWTGVSTPGSQIEGRSINMWLITTKRHFVPLHVTACNEARIALSNKPGADDEIDSYYVILGTSDNQRTVIRQGMGTEELYAVNTPDILDCNETKAFWLSFYDNRVEMGHGLVYPYFRFVDYTIPRDDFIAQAMGMALPEEWGYWVVKRNHADGILYETAPFHSFDNYWQTVRSDYIIYFRLKGERDAHLLFTRVVGFTIGDKTELILAYQNEYTVLREVNKDGSIVEFVRTHTPGVLSVDEWRGFWVCWLDGYIKVGAGFIYGERVLLTAPDRNAHNINGLSISSQDTRLSWEFESHSGDNVYMRTPTDSLEYKWIHLYHRDGGYWFYFMLAGAEASLLLSENYREDSNSYRIGIGENYNTRVSLYRGNKRVAQYEGPNIIDTNEMKNFWVSWTDGRIKFGQGPYKDTRTLIDHADSGFNKVEGVAVAGTDEYVAYWRFYEHQSIEEFTFDTNKFLAADQVWLSLMHRTHLLFSVKACENVHVFLSAVMHSTDPKDYYQITIQNEEGYTSIWAPFLTNEREVEMIKRVEVSTPDLLHCGEERLFWISFGGDNTAQTITLGTGSDHGVGTIISYHDFDAIPIRAVSFTTKDTTSIVRVPLSSRVFASIRDPPSNAMTAGEIVAAVFGFIALFALFAVAVIVIMRPPDKLKKYLAPPGEAGAANAAPSGFDNPLQETPESVESGYNQ